MLSLYSFIAPPSPCGYLPTQQWSLEYELIAAMSPADYMQRMKEGWRRFGHMVFRPKCRNCSQCRSVRVAVDRFTPNRSQRRVRKLNEGQLSVAIGPPSVSPLKLHLYDRYHAFQTDHKDWPAHAPKDPDDFCQSFIDNPFATEEWSYYVGSKLVGVGYVDALPEGLSAIYFFYDPDERDRQLGTFNVLSLIDETRRRGLPHLYLGYYVQGCPSLEYKASFRPNETLESGQGWTPFREA
ncbi:MAG: arginyltransferase [Planctomycetota bacterium]|jgi:arginyl-tRNA--protein-N-Asp/Glu arginylyltransferase